MAIGIQLRHGVKRGCAGGRRHGQQQHGVGPQAFVDMPSSGFSGAGNVPSAIITLADMPKPESSPVLLTQAIGGAIAGVRTFG